MHEWVNVAQLTNTKNLNGGLVAQSAAGLPFLLSVGTKLSLVPPVIDAPRHVQVEDIRVLSEDEAVVFLTGVKDAETANMLVGCHCLVRREDIPEEALMIADAEESWDGWIVVDENAGVLGTVSGVEDRAMQPLLVIERDESLAEGEGQKGELWIPLVDEFILDVDESQSRILVSVPAGLLAL